MSEQYFAILEGVLQYEQKQQSVIIVCFIVLLLVIGVLAIARFKKTSFSNKIVICLIAITLCVVFILYIVNSNRFVEKLKYDIANAEFVTYNGEYTHDDYQKDSFYHNVYISENSVNNTVLRFPDYGNMHHLYESVPEFPIGTFKGTIVYSAKSKIVVDWHIDE